MKILMKSSMLVFIFCYGCATNPFTEFYTDNTGGIDVTMAPTVILPTGEPQIFSGNNVENDSQSLWENGYLLLGSSYFNGSEYNQNQLIAQAKKVHAEIVVCYSQYTNTITGTVPLTLPDITTVKTNNAGTSHSSGNIYGYDSSASYSGTGSYSGTSNTTIYGSKTIYMPFSENRYDYYASYWIKSNPPIFGAYTLDLSPEIRETIGSNKGVVIWGLIKNSPAFMADVLSGDIIKKFNGIEITNAMMFQELLHAYAGQTVSVELIRNGNKIVKEIVLNKPY